MFAYKFLCIVVYKKIISLDDDFMGWFLNLANILVSFILSFVAMGTQSELHLEMKWTGQPDDIVKQSPFQFE